jgi:hypothetical protein
MASTTACSTSAGKLLVHGLQRHGLALRFGQFGFEHADLGLQGRQCLLALPGQGTPFLGHGVAVGEAPRQFLLQAGDLHARVDPLRNEQGNGDGGNAHRRSAHGIAPPAGGWRRISLSWSFHERRSIA